MSNLRVIAADSSTALLGDRFEPLSIVASASVLVCPPYREACAHLSKPLFMEASSGHEVIVHEAELCLELAAKLDADVVHLDMSLGSTPVEELSPIQFTNMRISARAKSHLLKILPKLRKTAAEITRKHGIEVLAIGKESIPVRIAELTSGAHAVLYGCERALQRKETIVLGLPSKCQYRTVEGRVYLQSLMAAEHDVRGCAEDAEGVLKKVNISEMLNPIARGFRILKIAEATKKET